MIVLHRPRRVVRAGRGRHPRDRRRGVPGGERIAEQTVVETTPSGGVSTAGGLSPVVPTPTSTPLRPDQESRRSGGRRPVHRRPRRGRGAVACCRRRDGGGAGAFVDSGANARPLRARAPRMGARATEARRAGRPGGVRRARSVRSAAAAGACNYQMVSGNGSAKDRFLASQQAKRPCEASARAKGPRPSASCSAALADGR